MALEQNVSLQVAEDRPGDLGAGRRPGVRHLAAGPTGQFRFQSLEQPVATILQSGADQLRAGSGRSATSASSSSCPPVAPLAGLPGLAQREQQPVRDVEPEHAGQPDVHVRPAAAAQPQIDTTRQQILISKNNLAISEMDFRNTVVAPSATSRTPTGTWCAQSAPRRAAADAGSVAADARRQPQARRGRHDGPHRHRRRPRPKWPRNEEDVIIGEQTVAQAQDRLRALILDPRTPEFWTTTFEPADPPSLATSPVDVDAAVQKAMPTARPAAGAQAAREQRRPHQVLQEPGAADLTADVNYGLAGLGGTVSTARAAAGSIRAKGSARRTFPIRKCSGTSSDSRSRPGRPASTSAIRSAATATG